ncbi:MAG: iron ABC transporter permease [Deltaproteobacteria bacterium]|nr:iron ABC transporter permease [Deltaproteobacteria bacterium]MBW1950355.1 iron ABC transporter permease [Deltaproteobacteria bacterium]MBW2008093.1 iron ABC transporter permease [Deltaproteobacteria bacterium]
MKPGSGHLPCKAPLSASRVALVSAGLILILFVTILFSLWMGTADVSMGQLLNLFSGGMEAGDTTRLIVLKIRLPRVLLAGLAGFCLALGGVVFQAILGNPLADPFILGVSSGSALGAVAGIMLGLGFTVGVPLASFGGALLSIALLMAVGTRAMGMESSTILLTGVIINAFFSAVIMFFIATAADDRLHTMLFWLYGDLSQSRMSQSFIVAPAALAAFGILYGYAGHLNLVTAGEDAALQLGVDTQRLKLVCLVLVSLIIGVVVSFSGIIGFVGLMVPHLCRMAFGSDHRMLMPVSALSGAIFLILADTLSRTIISPSELPVGVITAFLGAPFFIYLLRKRGSRWNGS